MIDLLAIFKTPDEPPMECRNCGCRDLRHLQIIPRAKTIRLRAQCRHCGRPVSKVKKRTKG